MDAEKRAASGGGRPTLSSSFQSDRQDRDDLVVTVDDDDLVADHEVPESPPLRMDVHDDRRDFNHAHARRHHGAHVDREVDVAGTRYIAAGQDRLSGLGAAGPGPWSDRAAVVPGYAARSDPACHDPAAPPDHADSGAFGPWSRPSARAAIGPASGLACVAAMALACHARAESRCPERTVIVAQHRRVALLRLACFGLTPRPLPPIAQPH